MEQVTQSTRSSSLLKRIYLYLVSLISLIMIIIACVSLINLGLKALVFKQADLNYTSYPCPVATTVLNGDQATSCDTAAEQQQAHQQMVASNESEASRDLALLIVGIPIFWYHWRLVRKEAN